MIQTLTEHEGRLTLWADTQARLDVLRAIIPLGPIERIRSDEYDETYRVASGRMGEWVVDVYCGEGVK